MHTFSFNNNTSAICNRRYHRLLLPLSTRGRPLCETTYYPYLVRLTRSVE